MDFLNNWKTTMVVIMGAIAFIITKFTGLEVPQEFQDALVVVVITLVGWFAKDGDKTGTTTQPRE